MSVPKIRRPRSSSIGDLNHRHARARLSVKINTSTMSYTPTTPSGSPLTLFVLLPASAHSNQPIAADRIAPPRPSPLSSRQSGSTIPSLKSLNAASLASQSGKTDDPESQDIDKVVVPTRRLSLAPGIGAGTQTDKTASRSRLDTIVASPKMGHEQVFEKSGTTEAPSTSSSTSSKPSSFGSKAAVPGRSRRRPQTSSGSPAPIAPLSRGSIAVPNGRALLGSGKTRPGWEGDEVVGVLRGSGLEVTVLRHAAQLPAILSPLSTSHYVPFNQQQITARPSSPTPLTPVILVPLSDSPTIPSLSLLLNQGTTPTAVCFQQDLLDRAKRSEEEWLPAALAQIQQLMTMKEEQLQEMSNRSTTDSTSRVVESPIILAYSANPALSVNTIAACVSAGAMGVLKPPYDMETASVIRRMVRAAKEGRLSSIVGLSHGGLARSLSNGGEESPPHNVVLPPTALSIGGEHEGEKVLSGAYQKHRRGTSASFGQSWATPTQQRSRESSMSGRKGSFQNIITTIPALPTSQVIQSPVTARTPVFPDHGDHDYLHFESLLSYNPSVEQRRRSVDTSGLGMALRRAQKAFETGKPNSPSVPSAGIIHQHSEDDHDQDSCQDTQLAELLSAMFYQTLLAIDIEMNGYEEFSAPITREHRERLIDSCSTWSFKPHHLDEEDLYRLACILFDGLLHSEGLVELGIKREQMDRLLFAIRAIYHAPNPYHNYIHAIDVLQATYTFLISLGVVPPFEYLRNLTPETPVWKRSQDPAGSRAPGSRRARQTLRPQDVFAIVLAAMGHDVGHPGLSNAFMKNAKTPLSQVYDDKSVLENMHCMLVVQLLRKHGFSFLLDSRAPSSDIPARAAFDTKIFRRLLYSSVLATDMSLHFTWMQNLQNFGEKISHEKGVYGRHDIGPGQADDEDVEADRILIAQSLIKCADISNPTRPIDVSEHWSTVLLKEWAVQASLETDLSLPVSVIASADAALQAKGQIGFIKLFTQPLFDAVSDVLPEMQQYADWCAGNCDIWESRSERLKEDDASVIIQPAVEDASFDERFSTLFPLSLPISLVESRSLEPGPVPAGGQATSVGDDLPSSAPVTPNTPRKRLTHETHRVPESPSAKALRAVYHANLLDSRHQMSSWNRRVPVPGLTSTAGILNQRRSSTPAFVAD